MRRLECFDLEEGGLRGMWPAGMGLRLKDRYRVMVYPGNTVAHVPSVV